MANGVCGDYEHRDDRGRIAEATAFDPTTASSIWFKEDRTTAAAKMMTAEAKTICRELCPVQGACLAYALAAKIDDGVWGAHSPAERIELRRRDTPLVAVG